MRYWGKQNSKKIEQNGYIFNRSITPVAMITGAGRGLGIKIAEYLATLGFGLVLHYNKSREAVLLADILHAEGRVIRTVQCDFNDVAAVHAMLNEIDVEVHLLINNAAIFYDDSLHSFNYKSFISHLNINYITPIVISHWFSKQLKQRENSNIINILDYSISKTPRNFFSYHSSKASLAYFTKIAARQLAPYIRVNAIALGYVTCNGHDEEKFTSMVTATPLGKEIIMEDIYNAIYLIVHSFSMTGQIITLDGGAHLADNPY